MNLASGGFSSEEACSSLLCPSTKLSTPDCLSGLSSQPQDPNGPRDPAAKNTSDLTDLSQPANTDPAATSAVHNVIRVKMDDVSLHVKDTLQRKVEGERHTDTDQTTVTDVYIPDTESSLSECSRLVSEELSNQTDPQTHQQVPYHCLKEELSGETKQEGFGKVCNAEIKDTGSESPLVLHVGVAEESSCIKAYSKDLIEVESLDLVFETSVDGSDYENGEGDAFFRQLDTEGQVFWAEPVQICLSPPLLEDSCSFDGSSEHSVLPKDPGDSFSPIDLYVPLDGQTSSPSPTVVTDKTFRPATDHGNTFSVLTPAPTSDHRLLSRSVSVQMSSSPSSHIVHRKDVPYVTDSKRTLPPPLLPLDTSSPFRAVQSWTDLHMQRKKNLSCEILDAVPNEVTLFTRAPQKLQRPAQMFSSTPSFPLQSNNWQSHESLAGNVGNYRTVSVSVDTGLSPPKDKDNNRSGRKDEKQLWEDNQTTSVVCCCSCDRQCVCCLQKGPKKQQSVETIPVSSTTLSLLVCYVSTYLFNMSLGKHNLLLLPLSVLSK